MNFTQPACFPSLLGGMTPPGVARFPEEHSTETKTVPQWDCLQPTIKHFGQRMRTHSDLERQLKLVYERVTWSARQARAPEQAAYRYQEMAWLRSHLADLAVHRGRWVVLEGQGILASEQDYLAARHRATLAGVHRPLIFFVPDDGADAFIGV